MKKVFSVLVLIMLCSLSMFSQISEAKYKAIFTLNMVRFFDWGGQNQTNDFVIGVLKGKEIGGYLLENTNGKKFGYRNVVVKLFDNYSDMTDCDVLYVSRLVPIDKCTSLFNGKYAKSLVITEYPNGNPDGSIINFIVVDDMLKFEVSNKNAVKHGLVVSDKLGSSKNSIVID